MPTAPAPDLPKPPTRNVLRAWARARDRDAWTAALETLARPDAAAAATIALQSAMRAGWVEGIERLCTARVMPVQGMLSIAWKDLRNPVWSGTPQADRVQVETWLNRMTWGPATSDEHRAAQPHAGVYALRSALDNDRSDRWAMAMAQGTPVNTPAGHRLLTTLLNHHLDWSVEGRALTGWRLAALYELVDRGVPMEPNDLLAVFDRGEDALFHRCLGTTLDAYGPEERALLLARAGVIQAYRRRVGYTPPAPRRAPPSVADDRAERWFRAITRAPIVAVLHYTPKTFAALAKKTLVRNHRLWERVGISQSVGPELVTHPDGHVDLFVADHWWMDSQQTPNEERRATYRDYLQGMVDIPKVQAELRATLDEVDNVEPARRRSRL